ncbi:butyrophilin subfamily 3 member A1-like [Hemiscyllium ocellatum]|uniref:butyrophilin subfamily 3 member A1-like n=1 Tax=Hemiscyllium ocellatum TaxID=170820 RepID=UPI002966B558|nr:butyrophilin subfamily 3 member A1-like [Hemiscyllium ocellatum]
MTALLIIITIYFIEMDDHRKTDELRRLRKQPKDVENLKAQLLDKDKSPEECETDSLKRALKNAKFDKHVKNDGIKKEPREKAVIHFDEAHSDPQFVLHRGESSATWGGEPEHLSPGQRIYLGNWRLWGAEGFTSGTHYWEVQVEDGSAWFVGVSVNSYKARSWLKSLPSSGLWLVMLWNVGKGKYPSRSLGKAVKLVEMTKVGVLLDFDGGQVGGVDLFWFCFSKVRFAVPLLPPYSMLLLMLQATSKKMTILLKYISGFEMLHVKA